MLTNDFKAISQIYWSYVNQTAVQYFQVISVITTLIVSFSQLQH